MMYWFSVSEEKEEIPPGTFHNDEKEEIPPGTFHNDEKEEIPPGTFHNDEKEEIPPGTFHADEGREFLPPGTFWSTITYRTKNGRGYYKFSIELQPGGFYRAYILEMPAYGLRSTTWHVTHRLPDGVRIYVCLLNESTYRTVEKVKTMIAFWADYTQKYIETGVTIDQQVASAQAQSRR